ncbi:MAG: multidrug efflux RND transporter permease subunit [Thalassobaculum sp.]|uniref:efflux RND transporter permease subunit n=1 Tax=Thalassobaculum sp. TaxID=2022740 RepID=UPI0032EB0746
MRLSHFFIDRPIFASVVAVLITLVGAISYIGLPVAQYPEIAPPTIQVTATYPGASTEVVADTVATPLEQEINGVENMLYMSSQSTADGRTTITVTFRLGTDLDEAQVLVQNRVAIAEPRLPEEVQRLGVVTRKNSPDLMMVIHVYSPGDARDSLYLSNYAKTQIIDRLARLDGVGEARVFAEREFSMRIWLNPELMAARALSASEVVAALRANNLQVASGSLNQLPVPDPGAFQLNVETLGRLVEPEQFENIVVKTDADGRVTRVRDIARVELGARDYSTIGYLDENTALPILIFQRPGSNALATADAVLGEMRTLAADFPDGVAYEVAYNPTDYIAKSIDEVYKTIFEAVALVVLVVIVFLQTWRAAVIPILAIPVSLIGTFAVMAAFGFSLNNLSLFGLVLAIGIVVDDAIVVVENVERYLAEGMEPKEAAHRTMDEVGGALIAIALVLSAVFIPTAFITGISGQFYQQFALTIASATVISLIVSLTLSPAMAALLLKPHRPDHAPSGVMGAIGWPFRTFARLFNTGFDGLARGYGGLSRRLIRVSVLVLAAYAGLLFVTGWQFERTPTGFIPEQDQGYMITVVQLPAGASLARTDAVVRQATRIILDTPGTLHTAGFAGFDGATFTNAPNAGAIFFTMKPFAERQALGLDAATIQRNVQQALGQIKDAYIFVVAPPPVRGIGTGGGFKMYVQDRRNRGLHALEGATRELVGGAFQTPGIAYAFTLFNTSTPKLYADIDRVKAEMLGLPPEAVFDTLEVYLGSAFVNDFNFLGRTFRVTAQADGEFRDDPRDVALLRAKSTSGEMVPIGSVATFRDITGPTRVARYNLYPAAELQGAPIPGVSTGAAIAAMEELAARQLPYGFSYEWTELALQEKLAGNTAAIAFTLAVVFVFLLLAAQYESLTLPLAVILIVPMCLLAAVTGVVFRGLDNNVLVQIGFVVLVGLAAKNAILIVEFAKQGEDGGLSRAEAAVQAAITRLRPILMTSFAFILGVLPLVLAEGAGAEMRQSLGTAVFSGMVGVTLFGLLFTPVFYVVCRWLTGWRRPKAAAPAE